MSDRFSVRCKKCDIHGEWGVDMSQTNPYHCYNSVACQKRQELNESNKHVASCVETVETWPNT